MYINGIFFPGIVLLIVGAALALGRAKFSKNHPNALAAVGLALACAGALLTVAL